MLIMFFIIPLLLGRLLFLGNFAARDSNHTLTTVVRSVTFDAELKLLLANPVEEIFALRQAELIHKVGAAASWLCCHDSARRQTFCGLVQGVLLCLVITGHTWTTEQNTTGFGRTERAACI